MAAWEINSRECLNVLERLKMWTVTRLQVNKIFTGVLGACGGS